MRTDINHKKPRRSFLPALAFILLLLALRGAPLAGRAQESRQSPGQVAPPTQPESRAQAPGVLVATDEDYRIGPRDVIEVQVEDAPELSGIFQVSSNGAFTMHYLGRITAEEKTPEELRRVISERLRGRYLKDPKVSIAVKQYNSRSFFIQGAVRNPGVYQLEGKPSLLKLVTIAGGLNENHGSVAFIIRETRPQRVASEAGASPAAGGPSDDDASYEMKRVNINRLLKGRFDQNVQVEPGDIVNIPMADLFFVAGEVESPGSFPLKEGTTLRQAISLAQGMTFQAAKDKGIIFREDESGKRQEIPVDVGAVMAGKSEDVPILANDVIIIANSRFKSVGGALLRAFGMATVQRGPAIR